jgi:hypothetical protein
MKRREAPGKGTSSVWELADFFRSEAPEGWLPEQLSLKRDLHDMKREGDRWDVSAFLRVGDDGVFVLTVMVLEDIYGPVRGVRRGAPLLAFLERLEKKVARLGFFGRCKIDDLDGRCSGSFTKYVKDVDTLRRELSVLAGLRLGQPVPRRARERRRRVLAK